MLDIQNPSDVVLDLTDASPVFFEGGLAGNNYNLRILPKQCVLIECRDTLVAGNFADFCSGLIPLANGSIEFLGLNWQEIDDDRANALRGMIGRVSTLGGWVERLGMDINILWQQLYHTETSVEELTERATKLAIQFGLPGIPVLPPNRLSQTDRQRCQWVRAFLGNPRLMILEYPLETQSEDYRLSFVKEVSNAHSEGTSTIWFAKDLSVWDDPRLDKFPRYRLDDDGLTPLKGISEC